MNYTKFEVEFIRLVPTASIPKKSNDWDAGFDLTCVSKKEVHDEDNTSFPFGEAGISLKYVEYSTGIAVNIPKGYVGLLFPRSSVTNKDLMLKNSVGVIDAGYQGEIKVRFKKLKPHKDIYSIGDRIAQLVIIKIPDIELTEVKAFSNSSNRGEKGLGSTGN